MLAVSCSRSDDCHGNAYMVGLAADRIPEVVKWNCASFSEYQGRTCFERLRAATTPCLDGGCSLRWGGGSRSITGLSRPKLFTRCRLAPFEGS